MRRPLHSAVLLAALASAGACSSRVQESTAAETAFAAVTSETPSSDASAGSMAHGDHNPQHGGVVYMYDELHYEVVLAPDGHHQLFFSDASRDDLPASVASSVTLTVERVKGKPEPVTGEIDESGERWLLNGEPVVGTDASVRVAFVTKGTPYWIDVPFIPAAP